MMKKEYVKPQNRVVYLNLRLMEDNISFSEDGPGIGGGGDAKQNDFYDSDDDHDVWED